MSPRATILSLTSKSIGPPAQRLRSRIDPVPSRKTSSIVSLHVPEFSGHVQRHVHEQLEVAVLVGRAHVVASRRPAAAMTTALLWARMPQSPLATTQSPILSVVGAPIFVSRRTVCPTRQAAISRALTTASANCARTSSAMPDNIERCSLPPKRGPGILREPDADHGIERQADPQLEIRDAACVFTLGFDPCEAVRVAAERCAERRDLGGDAFERTFFERRKRHVFAAALFAEHALRDAPRVAPAEHDVEVADTATRPVQASALEKDALRAVFDEHGRKDVERQLAGQQVREPGSRVIGRCTHGGNRQVRDRLEIGLTNEFRARRAAGLGPKAQHRDHLMRSTAILAARASACVPALMASSARNASRS